MAKLGQLKKERKELRTKLAEARAAGKSAKVSRLKKQLRGVRSQISEKRGLPEELGRVFGKQVQKKPFKFKRTREELEEELRPFFEERTEEEALFAFAQPLEDIEREEVRFGEDVARQEEQFAEDITTGRARLAAAEEEAAEQRDIIEGQERRGQIQQFGARGISQSPAAVRLRERLERVQQARAAQQARGFTEAGEDVAKREERFGLGAERQKERTAEDIARQRTRIGKREDVFRAGRERAFQTLLGEEISRTVF